MMDTPRVLASMAGSRRPVIYGSDDNKTQNAADSGHILEDEALQNVAGPAHVVLRQGLKALLTCKDHRHSADGMAVVHQRVEVLALEPGLLRSSARRLSSPAPVDPSA